MASRDPTKRRKIRALEAQRDTHTTRISASRVKLKTISAEIKALKAKR